MKRKFLPLAYILILLSGIGVYFAFNSGDLGNHREQAVAALLARSLADPDGNAHAMGQWKGKTLIVNFWATWCAPCVEEIPELSALQPELGSKNAQILGIGIDSPANIREFAKQHNVSYPLLVGGVGGSELAQQFGDDAGALPFTVVIAADGKVRKTFLGRLKLEHLRRELSLN